MDDCSRRDALKALGAGIGLTVLGAPLTAAAYTPGAVKRPARISGVVRFRGKAPRPKKVRFSGGDAAYCRRFDIREEALLVGKGGALRNVALALKELGTDADEVTLISKSHARTAGDMQAAVDDARRVMQRERIDVFHLHAVSSPEDFEGRRGAFETLVRLKSQGVIRAIALSVHALAGLEPVADNDEIDIVMPSINTMGMGINDATIEEMLAACRRLRESGKGVYAMKPLAGGHLHGSVVESLNYIRGLSDVDAVAVGMKTLPEVEMNVTIFDDRPVPKELIEQVHARPKHLLIYPICKGCGACVEHCQQQALTLVDGKAVVDMTRCILCGYCAEECPTISIRVV